MDDQRQEPTNGLVVAASGAGAGLLAGLLVLLGRRDEPTPVAERSVPDEGDPAVVKAARRAHETGSRLAAAWPENRDRIEEQARTAAAATKRRAVQVTSAVDRDALPDAGAAVDRLRQLPAMVAGREGKRGARKGPIVRNPWTKPARRPSDRAAATAQAVASRAAATAAAGAERARDRGLALAGAAKERLPGGSPSTTDQVVSSVRDAAAQAASTAGDLWQTARSRAVEAAPTVDLASRRAQAAHAAQAVQRAAHAAQQGGVRARHASTAVAGRASGIGHQVRVAPRRAADATVDTTKDTGALLLWGGAAGALLFYGLLTPEQRDQLSETARTASGQIRELVRDFQGYDDDF